MSKLHARAKLAGKVLRFVPFLRMAALNGSIVRGEETSQSDIDILIISKAGRLYTCRFFATFLIGLTGIRRSKRRVAARICLNCYLSALRTSIKPEKKKNLAKVARAYKYSLPLVDSGMHEKFLNSNKWMNKYRVNGKGHSKLLKTYIFIDFPFKPHRGIIERILSKKIGDKIESLLMDYQIKRIISGKQRGDEIYADRSAIKLHPKKH